MTARDLIAAYRAGERQFADASLRGANLRGYKLSGGWDLLGINLKGYQVQAFRTVGAGWVIQAGCRLLPMRAALRHWGSRGYDSPSNGRWMVRRIKLLWEEAS